MIRYIFAHTPSQKPVPELLRRLCRPRARKWTRGAPQTASRGSQTLCARRKTIFMLVINFHRPSAAYFTLLRPLPADGTAHSALRITGGACAGLGAGLAARDRRDGSNSLTRSVRAEENLFRDPRRLPVVLSRRFHSDAAPPR